MSENPNTLVENQDRINQAHLKLRDWQSKNSTERLTGR
jgi:hypothetical protein